MRTVADLRGRGADAEREVRICLVLLGVRGYAEQDPSYICAESPVTRPHVTSAFPLLEEGS